MEARLAAYDGLNMLYRPKVGVNLPSAIEKTYIFVSEHIKLITNLNASMSKKY